MLNQFLYHGIVSLLLEDEFFKLHFYFFTKYMYCTVGRYTCLFQCDL